jgi:hypothetical protein
MLAALFAISMSTWRGIKATPQGANLWMMLA